MLEQREWEGLPEGLTMQKTENTIWDHRFRGPAHSSEAVASRVAVGVCLWIPSVGALGSQEHRACPELTLQLLWPGSVPSRPCAHGLKG